MQNMKAVVAALIIPLFVSISLNYCDGLLECKQGVAMAGPAVVNFDKSENKTCTEKEKATICAAIICTKAGLQRGFSRIAWACKPNQRTDWAEKMKKDWFENETETELASIECRTVFGEGGKNMSNVNIQLPEVPKGLQCLYGERDEYGIGNVDRKECLDDDHHCFKANCDEGNGHVVHTEFGCSFDTNSTSLTAKVEKSFNLSVNCAIIYGTKDASFSNSNLQKKTTTSIEKPTTSTTANTTTTTTPEKTSAMTTPDTNVDFGEGRKTGLLCVLDKICTILFAKEKKGTAKPSRRFAPYLVKESGKCKNLGYEIKAAKDQVENLGNELSESIQKVGLVFVDDYILAIE